MLRRQICFACGLAIAIFTLIGCPGKDPPAVRPADAGTSSADDPDPHWVVQQRPPAKVALVYVHGVIGDMVGTWTSANGKKFFDLVNENESLKGQADAFVYGFPSYLFKGGSFDIQQAANKLHERLEYHQVLKYPAVVFVAHSMGGLVVMRELLTHREVLEKVPVVMFYATPMEGSLIAEIGRRFSPNSALAQMTPADGNALLQILDNEWKSIPSDKRPHVRCAYENESIGPLKIVAWASATRFCEGATPAIEATHITIVKPDRPGADAIVYLANALNEYVIGEQLEPKLQTPDFTQEGDEHVFVLTDSFGRQTARLLNEGGGALRFTFAEISDPSLWLSPDDTPRDIPPHGEQKMSIGVGRGAKKSEYRFVLRTPIQSDMQIIVRVPDLAALHAQQDEVAKKVGEQINNVLSDPQQLQRFQLAATDDGTVPAAIVQIVRKELARQNPQLPESAQWVMTADLLNSLNWSTLAANALRNAEKASPSIVGQPNVQFLSGVVAARSGEPRIFTSVETPFADPTSLAAWKVEQPFATTNNAAVGDAVAWRMQQIPSLKVFGLSLEGDMQQFKGNTAAAHAAFTEAAKIRPTPSVSTRLQDLQFVPKTPLKQKAQDLPLSKGVEFEPAKRAQQREQPR
jgi:pimeloyl-ACP methyl ester carboxylesterase